MKPAPLTAAILAAMPLLTACQADLRELCYDHHHWGEVSVAFEWQKAPAITTPGMTVLFYGEQQPGGPERYDFAGRHDSIAGTARLTTDNYRAIAYNNDTETILYRHMDTPDSLEAYTRYSSIEEGTQMSRSAMPRAAKTEEEPVILEPDPLCTDVCTPFTLGISQQTGITFVPQMRTKL